MQSGLRILLSTLILLTSSQSVAGFPDMSGWSLGVSETRFIATEHYGPGTLTEEFDWSHNSFHLGLFSSWSSGWIIDAGLRFGSEMDTHPTFGKLSPLGLDLNLGWGLRFWETPIVTFATVGVFYESWLAPSDQEEFDDHYDFSYGGTQATLGLGLELPFGLVYLWGRVQSPEKTGEIYLNLHEQASGVEVELYSVGASLILDFSTP